MIGTLCTSKCTYQLADLSLVLGHMSLILRFAEVELEFVELDGV